MKFERFATQAAAKEAGFGADQVGHLINFAELRSGVFEPVRDLDARDFPLELREEFADARNYGAWALQQLVRGWYRNRDQVDVRELEAVLTLAVTASVIGYEAARRAEELQADWQYLDQPNTEVA